MTPPRLVVGLELIALTLIVAGVVAAWVMGLTGSLYAHM